MSLLPVVTAREMLRFLLKAGFKIIHQKGSHIRLWHPLTRKSTTVAMHVGDLSRKMITTILKQAGISIKEFLKLFRR